MNVERTIFSLQEFLGSVQLSLEEAFPTLAWVSAEILSLTVNRSGHCYLELVEKNETDPAASFVAQVRGVIWRSRYPMLESKFSSATGSRLQAGMKVLVAVRISFHPVYGMSLQIEDIDPVYTLGDMERQKQAAINRLRADGVWDMNRMVPMPTVPQRIAVISSATAAGYRDFMKELGAYGYVFDVTLFESSMQGSGAEEEVSGALGEIFRRHEEFDCVAMVRGGGATTDLNCFNSYGLASIVAQFPIPVLTGIGHDKDTSVVDMVAYMQLKTPTAVAGWIVDRAARFSAMLDNAARMLAEVVGVATMGAQSRLEAMQSELRNLGRSTLEYSSNALSSASLRLSALTVGGMNSAGQGLRYIEERMREAIRQTMEREERRMTYMENAVSNFSPKRLLRLGYSIARHEGRTLRSISEVEPGDGVELQLTDGTISATVNTRQENEGY